MLNTITINDDVNYAINKVVGRKPAKMGEVKVYTLASKSEQERLKLRETKVKTMVQTSGPKVETNVEQPVVNNQPQTQTITQPASPVQPEPKVENNVIKFPTVEEYQTRLLNKGVVCYNNVLGNIDAKAARKLRVDNKVVNYQDYVTKNVAVEPEPIVKEEVKAFDFSGVLNQPAPNNIIKFPSVETPKPSIDDYFKKENGTFTQPTSETPSKPMAEIIDIEDIRRKRELLDEKNKNISKMELSIQEAEARCLHLKQQLALVNQDLDNELEKTEDKELEKTMQLNQIQAEIIQMSELLNRGNQSNYEYEDTYGGKAM